MPEDNDPIKMIVELDEAELTRQVERAEQKINSGTGGTKGSPRGASGEDLNALLKYTQQSGKQVKDAINELNTLLKKGTRAPLQMDSTLRSIMRGYAATQNMGEYDEGGGAKYGKRQTSSIRAITQAFQSAIQNAMAVRKISLPVLNGVSSVAETKKVASIVKEAIVQTSPVRQKVSQTELADKKSAELQKRNEEVRSRRIKTDIEKSKAQAARDARWAVIKANDPTKGGGGGGGGGNGAGGGGGGGFGMFGGGVTGAIGVAGPWGVAAAAFITVLKGVGQALYALGEFAGGIAKAIGGALKGILVVDDPAKIFSEFMQGVSAAADSLGALGVPIKLVTGALSGAVGFMEDLMHTLGKANPAINAQIIAFDMHMNILRRQFAIAMQPALQAWLDLKKLLLSIMTMMMPLVTKLGEILAIWIRQLIQYIKDLNITVPKILMAMSNLVFGMAKMLRAMANFVVWMTDDKSIVDAILGLADKIDEGGKAIRRSAKNAEKEEKEGKKKPPEVNPFAKYNQAFLDAFRITPPQALSNAGIGSDYYNKSHRLGGNSWMNAAVAGPHFQLATHSPGRGGSTGAAGGSGGGAPPQQKGQVRLPRAAVPRTEIKNSFQMKVENDKILQETVAQVRSFLLQSMFGLRQEVQLMQAMIDPRGIR